MFPFIFMKNLFLFTLHILMLPGMLIHRTTEHSIERILQFFTNSLTVTTFCTKGRLVNFSIHTCGATAAPCTPTNTTWHSHALDLQCSNGQVCIKVSEKALITFSVSPKSSHNLCCSSSLLQLRSNLPPIFLSMISPVLAKHVQDTELIFIVPGENPIYPGVPESKPTRHRSTQVILSALIILTV